MVNSVIAYIIRLLNVVLKHGRIIHEADDEAEASGPGQPGAKTFLERKFAVL